MSERDQPMFALSDMFFAQTGKTALLPPGKLRNDASYYAARRRDAKGTEL
jgi:hypothetical protein